MDIFFTTCQNNQILSYVNYHQKKSKKYRKKKKVKIIRTLCKVNTKKNFENFSYVKRSPKKKINFFFQILLNFIIF